MQLGTSRWVKLVVRRSGKRTGTLVQGIEMMFTTALIYFEPRDCNTSSTPFSRLAPAFSKSPSVACDLSASTPRIPSSMIVVIHRPSPSWIADKVVAYTQ
jgi:hypothetical protein